MIFHCQKLNLGIHLASLHQQGMTRNKKEKICRPVTQVEVYPDSKEVCLKSLYCIHSYYGHPSEHCRSGSKPTFRWCNMSFPLQPCTVFSVKGSTLPVCLEGWHKKHPTCEKCIFVEARLNVRKGKRKNYLNRKHYKPHRVAVT